MPEYLNPHPYDVHLIGPDGIKVRIKGGRVETLPAYFEKYVSNGYIKRFAATGRAAKAAGRVQGAVLRARVPEHKRTITKHTPPPSPKQIVGKVQRAGSTESLHKLLDTSFFPISNRIGVGILSYNRPNSLKRLINSIILNSDLKQLTVFISDDGSSDQELLLYLSKLNKTNNFVVLLNKDRLGIAGNSNRLLRCLARFPYKILLNDDVEVLRKGWDKFYVDAMVATGFHHFMCCQPGVYGLKEGTTISCGSIDLVKSDDKPHGAVMVFDDVAFEAVGYQDEVFGYYGMEHVDWSKRVSAAGIQRPGFYDVAGSLKYFKIYPEESAVPNRVANLQAAKELYKGLPINRIRVEASDKTTIPRISCVIPFRDIDRHGAILTIVDNIRAQRFPDIEIIVSEQDDKSRFTGQDFRCVTHILTSAIPSPFNKSVAFNAGVARVTSKMLLLHDADIMVPAHYMRSVHAALEMAESTHLGSHVLYADGPSSTRIIKTHVVDRHIECCKTVTYFEGGSIACRTDVYWRVGGFVEAFVGYGVEDCDFYERLSKLSKWYENRVFDFLHLNHGRTPGWEQLHNNNKVLGAQIRSWGMEERVRRQHQYFLRTKYAKFIKQLGVT